MACTGVEAVSTVANPESVTVAAAKTDGNKTDNAVCGGRKLNFKVLGIKKVELESVDGYVLSGTAHITWSSDGGIFYRRSWKN